MMTTNNLPDWLSDELSVEANGDQPLLGSYSSNEAPFGDINSLLDDYDLGSYVADGVCDAGKLTESIAICTEPNEFDSYIGSMPSTDLPLGMDENLFAPPLAPLYPTEKTKKKKDNKGPILLSPSVGVGVSVPLLQSVTKLQIVHDLEEKYRPRYKSDYFGQNGRNRKPRYVADRKGNHYITLQVPPNTHGQIRVDWVTIPGENNERHSMPYRFQASNESSEMPDCNPIFESFKSDGTGTVKLYLVLIKAKQDALKSLQPLQPFRPMQDAFGIVYKPTPQTLMRLTPKQLIQKYQLSKSQLAFTLCTLGANGQSYVTEWDTTVYSTVLEEEVTETTASKTVCCPKCSCSITINDEVITMPAPTAKKRKNVQSMPGKLLMLKKQRTLPDEILPIT